MESLGTCKSKLGKEDGQKRGTGSLQLSLFAAGFRVGTLFFFMICERVLFLRQEREDTVGDLRLLAFLPRQNSLQEKEDKFSSPKTGRSHSDASISSPWSSCILLHGTVG